MNPLRAPAQVKHLIFQNEAICIPSQKITVILPTLAAEMLERGAVRFENGEALAGYSPTAEEVIAASSSMYRRRLEEQEFPNELYLVWHRLYDIPVPDRGKPWQFKHLTIKHIYFPLEKQREGLGAAAGPQGERRRPAEKAIPVSK